MWAYLLATLIIAVGTITSKNIKYEIIGDNMQIGPPENVDMDELQMKDLQYIIDHVNSQPENTWTAGHNFAHNATLASVVNSRFGLMDDLENRVPLQNEKHDTEDDDDDLPKEYDVRKKYPKCGELTYSVKDQSNCGSCWAVSAASALSDRYCIKSGGKMHFNLSANYLAACEKDNYGCEGGYMDKAWNFLKTNGLITGGDYDSDQGCQMYTIRPCGFVDTLPCTRSMALTPKCRHEKCNNEYYKLKNEQKRYKVSKYYEVRTTEKGIQKEIYTNGPITAGFVVYLDFMFYKSGVYKPQTYWSIGRHAVKVIGWGVEKDVKYWLVANSWSKRWGDHGFFKIIRGVNSCYIESNMHGGDPIIE